MGRLDRRSPQAEAYRKLYNTSRWQRIRDAILLRDRYTCRSCGRVEVDTSLLVCHHVDRQSKDNPATFYDGPFVAMCKPCHDGSTQSEEKIGFSKQVGTDGWPTDERHPANR